MKHKNGRLNYLIAACDYSQGYRYQGLGLQGKIKILLKWFLCFLGQKGIF